MFSSLPLPSKEHSMEKEAGGMTNFTVEKLNQHDLSQGIKVNTNNDESCW